jgi:hypothetical protein
MNDASKPFPILWPYRRAEEKQHAELGCPRSVPWSLVLPHEAQAVKNHSQSLERLAERGGLAPSELLAVIGDRRFHTMDDATAIAELKAAIAAHAGS